MSIILKWFLEISKVGVTIFEAFRLSRDLGLKIELIQKILTKIYVCSCIIYTQITEEFGIGLYPHRYQSLRPSGRQTEHGYVHKGNRTSTNSRYANKFYDNMMSKD